MIGAIAGGGAVAIIVVVVVLLSGSMNHNTTTTPSGLGQSSTTQSINNESSSGAIYNSTASNIPSANLIKEAADKFNSGETDKVFMQYLTSHADMSHPYYTVWMLLNENKDCKGVATFINYNNIYNTPELIKLLHKVYPLPEDANMSQQALFPQFREDGIKDWLTVSYGKPEMNSDGSITIINKGYLSNGQYPEYKYVCVLSHDWNDDPFKSRDIQNSYSSHISVQQISDFNKELPDYAKLGVLKDHSDLLNQTSNYAPTLLHDNFVVHFLYSLFTMLLRWN